MRKPGRCPDQPGASCRGLQLADVVRELVEAPEFSDMLDDLLDAIGKGFSVAEPIWQLIGDQFWPTRYEHRDPRWFQFDKVTGQRLKLRTDNSEGQEIPPGKLIVHKPRLKSGLPIRGGVARLVAVSFMCKVFGLKDWMRFAELFGMPLRISRYGPGATG